MKVSALAIVVLLSTGCGTKTDSAVEGLVADAHDVVLPNIRAAIAAGTPENAMPCSRVLANVHEIEKDGGHAEVAADIHQVCDHDIHVANMTIAVAEAEAARTQSPDEKVLAACFSSAFSIAVESLDKAGRFDAPAEALLARFAAACPDEGSGRTYRLGLR